MDADVIVVGAGAAGLAAARRLVRSGARIVLLEARDRAGGRIFSRPVEDLPVAAELGAELIHGRAPETLALLRETGGVAIDTGGEAWRCRSGELERDDDDFLESAALFDRALLLSRDQSVDEYLRRFEADEATREAARAARDFVEGFEAADPSVASVRAIAEEWASGVDSTSARPLSGYAQIVERLYRDALAGGAHIALESTVRAVAWRRGFVNVETTSLGGTSRSFTAGAAIVTLPVGVLRCEDDDGYRIRFDPELPPEKRRALQDLEMGHAVKVALWFRTPFWERIAGERYRDAAFFHCDRSFQAFWTQLPVRSRLVVAWAGGPKAIALRGLSEEELVARARDEFGTLFGGPALAREEFEGGAMHDWSYDEHSCGAYSYVAVGGGDARATLAAPLQRTLFFAGEATSTNGQGGTVNGALETGETAAAELLRRG